MTSRLGFSRKLKDIILFHHDPEFSPAEEIMPWIVSLSNELAHHLFDNKNIDIRRYLDKINLSQEDFKDIVQVAQVQIQQYQSIL